MANEDRQTSQGAKKAATPSFKKAIRLQGGVIEDFSCKTDVPVIIEGAVKGAHIRASWVEVLPGASMSGDVIADHMVVRGKVSSLTATVHDFFAMDSAVMEACHIIFDTVRGCSIHPQSQFLGSVQFSLKKQSEGKDAQSEPARHEKAEEKKPEPAPQQQVQQAPPPAPPQPVQPSAPQGGGDAAQAGGEAAPQQPQVSLGDASRAAAQYAQAGMSSGESAPQQGATLPERSANIEETDDGYASLGAPQKG